MKKVIVTGLSGQDCSYMVDYLLENTDNHIYCTLRHSANPNNKNYKHLIGNPRVEIVTMDLSDSQSVEAVVEKIKPDYFINFAAQSFVAESWQIPEQTFDVDAVGIIRILEAIRRHVPYCRFYSAGSSEEFADVYYKPQDENHPRTAKSVYGAAKIAARQIVKVYRESYGLYAVQGALFNHESPRRGQMFISKKCTMAVANILKQIKNNQPIKPLIIGNLNTYRDWSHAKDFVDGVWRMLNQEVYNPDLRIELDKINDYWNEAAESGGYLNIEVNRRYHRNFIINNFTPKIKEYVLSSNETHSLKELIELAFKHAGINIINVNPDNLDPTTAENGQQVNYILESTREPVVISSREFFRPADVTFLYGNSNLARKELGWQPKYSFEALIKEMVEYDIQNS